MQPSLSPTPPQGQEFVLLPSPGLRLASLEEAVKFPSSLSLLGMFVTIASIEDDSCFPLSRSLLDCLYLLPALCKLLVLLRAVQHPQFPFFPVAIIFS